ncbi:MAG: SCO family protein [Lacunisphaera sp.]
MKITSALLFLVTALVASAADKPAAPIATPADAPACCQKAPVAKTTDACCENPVAATPFSKESIYQLDGQFTNDAGQPFALSSLRGRPVVMDMFFASCGYACPLTVTDMLALQKQLPAELRDTTAFVLVSFDVARDTPEALAKYRAQRQLGSNWILLHGDDNSVRELAALLGVQYRQTADGAFSHSNQIAILNREGEIVHERKGLQGGLDESALALVQNSK